MLAQRARSCEALLLAMAEDSTFMRTLHEGSLLSSCAIHRNFQQFPELSIKYLIQALIKLGFFKTSSTDAFRLSAPLRVLTTSGLKAVCLKLSRITNTPKADWPSEIHWCTLANPNFDSWIKWICNFIVDVAIEQDEWLSERRRTLANSMASLMQNVPFNSFAAVQYAGNLEIDVQRGGNCMLHAMELSKQLAYVLPDGRFDCVLGHDQLHSAVIADFVDESYLLDTTGSLPEFPLHIPKKIGGKQIVGNLFWHASGRRSMIEIIRKTEKTIQLIFFNHTKKGFFQRIHLFDINAIVASPASYIRDAGYVKRISMQDEVLVYRICSEAEGVYTLFHSLITHETYFIKPSGESKIPLAEILRNDQAFERFLVLINMNKHELKNYIASTITMLNGFSPNP